MGSLPSGVADAAVASDGSTAWLLGGWRGSTVAQVAVATLKAATPVNGTPASTSASPTQPRAGSAAAVRPFGGLLLIADRGNNRLLVVDARKRIVWKYPSKTLPRPPFRFYFPDDAFWVHQGHAILVNEEENQVLAEIAYPSGRTLWTYGHAGVPGSSSGYLHQPDDVYPYPRGGLVVADALNCRILFFDAKGRPARQIGRTGNCTPNLPTTVGYPNGDTPLPSGQLLITQLNGGYVDRIESKGRIRWGLRVPGVPVPSDPQRLADGSYLVADYQLPGRIVRFTKSGRVLWTYGPSGGHGMLDHPSIAVPLPNGLVAATDDYQDRVVIIDPATNRIVWQYGVRGQSGRGPNRLHIPDGLDLLFADGTVPLHVDFANATTRPGRP